jgi:hypothetical protein
MNEYEAWEERYWWENWSPQSKICPSATLSTTNPTWTEPCNDLHSLSPLHFTSLHFHTDSIVILVLDFMKLTKHKTFQESQVFRWNSLIKKTTTQPVRSNVRFGSWMLNNIIFQVRPCTCTWINNLQNILWVQIWLQNLYLLLPL